MHICMYVIFAFTYFKVWCFRSHACMHVCMNTHTNRKQSIYIHHRSVPRLAARHTIGWALPRCTSAGRRRKRPCGGEYLHHRYRSKRTHCKETSASSWAHTYVHVCIYVWMYLYMCIYACMRVRAWMVRMCACMYSILYVYICIWHGRVCCYSGIVIVATSARRRCTHTHQ